MLKIQFKDKRREPVWIVDKLFTIGTAPNSNLVLDDQSLSPHHAELITHDGQLVLKAKISHPPCCVNGQVVDECEVRPGDTLTIGSTELDILHPHESITQPALTDEQIPKWALIASSSWLNGQEFILEKAKTILGRSSQCDIVIPGTHLSRQHVEIQVQGNQLLVRDLDSSNGTYLNNNKITEASAHPGDEIRIDIYPFKVRGPNTDHDKTRVRKVVSPPPPAKVIKADNGQPKKWKTRPTSPGNRIEPEQKKSHLPFLLSLLLCISMLAALIFLGLI
jgi:pSer/pThr/pTyr-binding forkhead associated (FHA) protein